MPNTVSIFVRSVNDTDEGFGKAKEGLGKALGAMKGLVASAAPGLAGPLVAAAGATTAAFASIGIAAGAFGAAVVPQFQDVTKAAELYTKAQESAAAGSASAAKDMEAYKQALKGMPPATRDTAVAFAGLKDNFKKWSDSLAGTTMPIFTQGLKSMSGVLPMLTPLVKTAAGAFKGMMDGISSGVKGGGFKGFLADANTAAKKTLPDFLKSLGNIGVGFAGIIRAFFPFSGVVTGGLEKATKKFRDFGAGLKESAGFKSFMDGVKDKIPGIVELFKNLAKTAATVISALAPFSGVGLAVVGVLAALVAAIPQGAMDFIAPMIMSIVVAVKAWTIVQGILNVVLAANPVGLVVLAIAALVAMFIVAWQRSQTFRDIVTLAFTLTAQAALTGAKLILMGIKWIVGAFLDMVGTILDGAATAFGWMPGIGGKIKAAAAGFKHIKEGAKKAFDAAINKVDEWNNKVKGMTKEVLIKGQIRDLESKLNKARAEIKSVPKSKRHEVQGRINDLLAKIRAAKAAIASLHGKTITITEYYRKVNAGKAVPYQHYAHGGVVGAAATGGPRGNLTWVGEQGPELADLAPGTMVHSAGDSKRMAESWPGGGSQKIQLEWVGGNAGDEFMTWIKKNIRATAGSGPDSVQRALGV